MLFFKVEGFIDDEKWYEINQDRREMKENARKLALRCDSFNQKFDGSVFFYIVDASEYTLTFGIICREAVDLNEKIKAFLNATEFVLNDIRIEEITIESTRHLTASGCRREYIYDSDDIWESFGLDKFDTKYGKIIDFREGIINEISKDEIYKKANRYLIRESFIPELDRIFAGKSKSKILGHPVHYIIQTDDRETQEETYGLLIRSLYGNSRLHSKRYSLLDFRPGDRFPIEALDYLYKAGMGGAVVIRYLADIDSEGEYASAGRKTISKISEVVNKYRNQVLTILCLPRECTKAKDVFFEYLGSTCFVEMKEDLVSGERAEEFLKMLAKETGIRTDKKLFDSLEADNGYLSQELHELFDVWYNNKLKTSVYPQYKDISIAKHKILREGPKGTAYDALKEMIGLEEAKNVIDKALNYYKAQKLFADKGMKTDRPAMHMVFTGNPGTAKTSVARLFSRIMKENGLLSKGELIEVGRGELVGQFVGWTAPTIQKKFREARGNVLFIDEAYSLVEDRSGSFGDEAINTIVQEMENHREDVVVIFAGYPDKMEAFIRKNPGLRSRIAFHIPFADYNAKELCDIAALIAKEKGLKLTEEASEKLLGIFEAARTDEDFGNGRFVRNIIEKAKMTQAGRLLAMDIDSIGKKEIMTICAQDIENPIVSPNKKKKQIGFF